ncbi:14652_t:CDS:2 [Gigaspora margarita]|uniref:14652_t:CDS:1 n=1 Tax=Gigaspora margarita TaxID=4874 RepID=A0ABN7UPQ5_GIGMA|nr:14652_t:CDS:2 [Gigaspora margarita]
MRLNIEIKGLFQKKEQEIVGILEKFKNRVLKKDKAVTKYLRVHAYRPCKHKLQARELQEEIVRINGTTHLIERESPMDIEMSEKEVVSPIITDVTNKSMSIQEENKESLPTKVGYLIHNKAKKDISASRWAPRNRVKLTSTNQTQVIQEITTMTNQSSSRQKPATIITIWDLPEDARVACIEIQCKDHSRLEALKNSWALHYEAGKLCQVTPGKFNADLLQKRNIYKAILQNIPRTTLESSLLKQLKYYKAKSVFIPNNRNGNTRSLVFIYFAESQDLNKATLQSNLQSKQDIATQEKESIESSMNKNTKTPCDMNNTGSLPERKLLEEILERLSNLEEKQSRTVQQMSENSSTSSFQTSRQLLKSCDNSAAPNVRKNSNNNIAPNTERDEILAHTKEHFSLQFKEKSLNLEEMPGKWKSIYKPKEYIQEGIYYSVNENITEEEWAQAVSTLRPEAEISEIHFLQGFSIGRIIDFMWNPKYSKLLQGLWKHNLTCQTIDEAQKRQISFKPNSIKWKIKGEGPTILELLSSKFNFKAAKTLEKFNIFYTNQLILQDDKTLVTWSQLKLIKGATRKGRKPIWFEHLESIVLQDSATRKIKDDFYTSTDLRRLAIPNLQRLTANRKIKDWVIAKETDRELILGHIIKKNSNSVLIEH